jgi:hypothetical protein
MSHAVQVIDVLREKFPVPSRVTPWLNNADSQTLLRTQTGRFS